MILTHRNGDLYSAATSLGIIAYNVDFESAADAIVDAVEGIELEQAYALLQSPVSPAEWKATLSAAMASDLAALEEQSEALAAATDSELVSLKAELEKVVKESGKAKDRQREIDSLRQIIRDREVSVRDALIRQFGDQYNEYWVSWSTRFERQRLAELEANNGEN